MAYFAETIATSDLEAGALSQALITAVDATRALNELLYHYHMSPDLRRNEEMAEGARTLVETQCLILAGISNAIEAEEVAPARPRALSAEPIEDERSHFGIAVYTRRTSAPASFQHVVWPSRMALHYVDDAREELGAGERREKPPSKISTPLVIAHPLRPPARSRLPRRRPSSPRPAK